MRIASFCRLPVPGLSRVIALHFSICFLACALTWRRARAVSIALAVVALATLGAEVYPSLLWSFVGPLAVAWLARRLWRLSPLEVALPAFAVAVAVLLFPSSTRLSYGVYVASAHLGVLAAGLLALRRRNGPVGHEELLAGVLLASSSGSAWGALCWGLWGTTTVHAIADIGFLGAVVLLAAPWRRSASS